MTKFFQPNLDRRGRWVRAIWGVLMLAIGVALLFGEGWRVWVGLGFVALGLLGLIEARRGWCLARACGLKTRL
jgi:uncharacterized membrane protein YjjP (DUF1212 family)